VTSVEEGLWEEGLVKSAPKSKGTVRAVRSGGAIAARAAGRRSQRTGRACSGLLDAVCKGSSAGSTTCELYTVQIST
jgi:hypothetical protein